MATDYSKYVKKERNAGIGPLVFIPNKKYRDNYNSVFGKKKCSKHPWRRNVDKPMTDCIECWKIYLGG